MSAAKKVAETKPADFSEADRGRFLGANPLPDGVCGPRLLVHLLAERAIEKLKLKERWECPDGWDFNDLCAVVACELGEAFPEMGERERLERIRSERGEKVVVEIQQRAVRDLFHIAGDIKSPKAWLYEVVLILGLGAMENPLDPGMNVTDGLAQAIIEVLRMDRELTKGEKATFARAKRNVDGSYKEHLVKQERREEMAAKQPKAKPVVKMKGRSEVAMLETALGQLALEGKISSPRTLEAEAVMRKVFSKAGLRQPGNRRRGK